MSLHMWALLAQAATLKARITNFGQLGKWYTGSLISFLRGFDSRIDHQAFPSSNGFGGRSSKPAWGGSNPLRGSRISIV